jgi:hypothetical protein
VSADPSIRASRRPIGQDEPRAIYSGDSRLGHLVRRGDEVHAFDRRHQPIGVFDDVRSAVAAVMRAAGGTA